MPDDIVTSGIGKGCRRVVTDITDAALFNDHPEFGLQARVSDYEARRTSKESPLKMAFLHARELHWKLIYVRSAWNL